MPVDEVYVRVYISVLRFAAPALAMLILWRVCRRRRALGLLTVFQLSAFVAFWLNGQWLDEKILGFAGLMIVQWALYLSGRKRSFWAETGVFFLCTVGFCVIASVAPEQLPKQLAAFMIGTVVYDYFRKSKQSDGKWAALLGLGLMAATLIWGQERYGSKSWIVLGPFSVQPSELGKLCFAYYAANVGWEKRDRRAFWMVGAGMCIASVLMNDMGTAMVYFGAVWMTAYLQSGLRGTLGFTGTGIAAAMLGLRGHALTRLKAWRHIWEYPLTWGYQQTKALSCLASGGLFGMGAGCGKLKSVFSADADMVFATMAEEWGLVVAVVTVVVLVVLVVQAVWDNGSLASCVAGTILLVQTALNVLGSVDILPMTGVTFPFVSNGGSSMVTTWGLLAFLLGERGRTDGPRGKKKPSCGAVGGVFVGRNGVLSD